MAMAIPSSCLSSGALHKITKEKPDLEYLDENTAAELAHGDYITVFKNIWSEMPTIRVIRVDYADGSRYYTDFQVHPVASQLRFPYPRTERRVWLPQEILMSAFNYIWENKEVHDV